MKKIPVSVGLDYSDVIVQVCVMDLEGKMLRNKKSENDWKTIANHVKPDEKVEIAVIEACSGTADLADELIGLAHWPVQLAMPGIVKRMKCNPDKTDWADARLLADLGRVRYVPPVWLAPKSVRELQLVVRFRQQLVDERRACKLRIGAIVRNQRVRLPGSRWSKPWRAALITVKEISPQGRWVIGRQLSKLQWLCKEITEVEAYLGTLAKDDWMVQWLITFKGVALVTASILRAEVGSFTRFRNAKALARFCALTPRNASSGPRQADAGLIRAGNRLLRRTLIELSHRLVRFEPRWKSMSLNMRARGKPACLVAAAVANRWVRSLHPLGVRLERAA